MNHTHPINAKGITPEYLNGLLAALWPAARVTAVDVLTAKTYGEEMVSTAGRAILDVQYAKPAPAGLPTRLVLKIPRGEETFISPLYENEVAFYRRIRPELELEAPLCFGADYNAQTSRFGILFEDLTQRGGVFPNVLRHNTLGDVRALLGTLAKLHARYWESPRFAGDLSWLGTHRTGRLADMMNEGVPIVIQEEIDTTQFKREMVQRLRMTGSSLRDGLFAVQKYQQTLPQTLLHGDTHIGNTYLLPDGRGGLLDWQLMVRGCNMHDVNYLIVTSLAIGERREHERELLRYYLDRLAANGVKSPPSFDATWNEYRRTLIWGVYIGWLTTPVVNYGWEINIMNHLRLTTAFEDLETAKLVAEVS